MGQARAAGFAATPTQDQQSRGLSGIVRMRTILALALCASLGAAASAKAQSASIPLPSTSVSKPAAAQKPKAQSPVKKSAPSQAKSSGTTRTSLASKMGLRSELSDVVLNSSAVLVIDQVTGEVLLEKNPDAVLPIASITKLMTAIVSLEANLEMSEVITISQDDTRLEKYTGSRLRVGSKLTRAELMHLALMSSENRAAHALGRTYPGGLSAFVQAMNEKAQSLGMASSHFVEPTGLSSSNVSSPRDLARLVAEAHRFDEIREFSTARQAIMNFGGKAQQYRNTNALARGEQWELGVSKTGFISDAGRCLVMQAVIDDQPVIMVMLDAQGTAKRISDAERIRKWISSERDRQAPRS